MREKSGRPNLRDVAKAAGVGSTTVSRVINGGRYVAPEVLAHVRKVIKDLGFEPNEAARSLKSDRTRTIGLIIPSITDPFFAHIAAVAEAFARQQDHVLILLTSGDQEKLEIDDLRVFERHRTDGLLLVPPRSQSRSLLDCLRRLSVPIVSIDRPLTKCSSVICDNREAARKAVQHLIDHGRKRILCLGGDPRLYTIRERVKGYTSAVVSAGLEILVDMEAADYPSAERIVLKRIAQDLGIDAVFGLYNQSTIHTYEVLRNHRIPVPKRISIVGFDDFSLASTVRPSITVVQQRVKEIAMAATQLLFDHIGGEAYAPRQIEIGSTLIVRQSCGCPVQHKH